MITLALSLVVAVVRAQIPTRMKQTWQMNLSTIVMPCNNSGFTDPNSTLGFGIVVSELCDC